MRRTTEVAYVHLPLQEVSRSAGGVRRWGCCGCDCDCGRDLADGDHRYLECPSACPEDDRGRLRLGLACPPGPRRCPGRGRLNPNLREWLHGEDGRGWGYVHRGSVQAGSCDWDGTCRLDDDLCPGGSGSFPDSAVGVQPGVEPLS